MMGLGTLFHPSTCSIHTCLCYIEVIRHNATLNKIPHPLTPLLPRSPVISITMSAPQIPSAGNNPDPNPGPNPGTGTSTGTDTTSQGSRWRGYSINPPRHWEQSKKRLCDCANHDQDEWPHDFAELIIAPCAYRCPFCNEFNKAQRTRLMASNLRRHITRTHIEGNPDVYGTLVVAPGWMK
ncbi:unnamed protein product [Penicillium nalgiovense]|nr:unnamed protein product [Penicillium nalgiovense]